MIISAALAFTAIHVVGIRQDVVVKKYRLTNVPAARFIRVNKTSFDKLFKFPIAWPDAKPTKPAPNALLALVDPTDNALVLRGSRTNVDEFVEVVRLFDVRPRRIALSITLTRLEDNDSRTFTATVDNNESWTVGSGSLGMQLDGAVRVNEDGTLTITCEAKLDGAVVSKPTIRDISGMEAKVKVANPGGEGGAPKGIAIAITPTILDN